jgi:hypothetical protein
MTQHGAAPAGGGAILVAKAPAAALADHEAEPSAIDPAVVGGGRTVSAPLLPLAAHPADWRPHLLVRSIFGGLATNGTRSTPGRSALVAARGGV